MSIVDDLFAIAEEVTREKSLPNSNSLHSAVVVQNHDVDPNASDIDISRNVTETKTAKSNTPGIPKLWKNDVKKINLSTLVWARCPSFRGTNFFPGRIVTNSRDYLFEKHIVKCMEGYEIIEYFSTPKENPKTRKMEYVKLKDIRKFDEPLRTKKKHKNLHLDYAVIVGQGKIKATEQGELDAVDPRRMWNVDYAENLYCDVLKKKYKSTTVAKEVFSQIMETARAFAAMAHDDLDDHNNGRAGLGVGAGGLNGDDDDDDEEEEEERRRREEEEGEGRVDILQHAGVNFKSLAPQTISAGRWVSYQDKTFKDKMHYTRVVKVTGDKIWPIELENEHSVRPLDFIRMLDEVPADCIDCEGYDSESRDGDVTVKCKKRGSTTIRTSTSSSYQSPSSSPPRKKRSNKSPRTDNRDIGDDKEVGSEQPDGKPKPVPEVVRVLDKGGYVKNSGVSMPLNNYLFDVSEIEYESIQAKMAHQAREDDETLIKETGVALNNLRKGRYKDKENNKILSKEQGRINRSGSRSISKPSTQSTKKQQKPETLKKYEEITNSGLQQAEARLKYLLSQSDIFLHFGLGKGKPAVSSVSVSAGSTKPGKREQRQSRSSGTFDEMAKATGNDDDEAEAEPTGTVLLRQPSCVSGGAMRPYQLEGLNWMIRLFENGINGILADEMGLGKTLQSISLLGYMHEYRNIPGPHLVMVPKSTLSNWMNEFKRWCPVLRVVRFHGSREERLEIAKDVLKVNLPHEQRGWDVVVTTYEVVNMEKGLLGKIAWRYLIIDEAHRLKNEASQFSQTVRQLKTQSRLLLTGTPLQNNLHELWALLNFLLPDVFASSEQFDDFFNLDVDDTEVKQRMIGQLHKILRPFMLRRLKIDVEKSLPPKTETILFTGLSTMQKNLYKQILLRDIDTVNGTSAGRTAVLNIVMQLRKCCNHPYLFSGVEDRSDDPMGEHLYMNCGKMVLLDKLLKKMHERGHRVLIFSQMTRMLDILEDYLISKGYQYCRIDGNTSYDEREDRIADYNSEGSSKFVFLLSTRAGGLGINLQTADTVILYDSDWNPQADLQAQDRAHRIGQTKTVQVFRLVTDETVEVRVVERAQQKLKLDAMVVQQGCLQDEEKKLSKEDLLATLRFGADKIFRTNESSITDADIDMILEEGSKRTEEMNKRLMGAEKGDMYNFSFDGSMTTQVFEGNDYSDKATRKNKLDSTTYTPFLDLGKRERKPIFRTGEKKLMIPRAFRLPKMEDWQFYDRKRLNELYTEELRLFDALQEKEEVPANDAGELTLLPPAQHEEKARILSEAFGEWTREHYDGYLKASANYGRTELEKIAKYVGKPVGEVRRYVAVFWEKGPSVFPAAEWEKIVKLVEKGEKAAEVIERNTTSAHTLDFPEGLLPRLTKILATAGPAHNFELVTKFKKYYPEIPTQLTKRKIKEIAVQDARTLVWTIKPEFRMFLHLRSYYLHEDQQNFIVFSLMTAEEQNSMFSSLKRKRGDVESPKKPKPAFIFFVQKKFNEVKKSVENKSDPYKVREILRSMWRDLDESSRAEYQQMEADDRARFNREVAAAHN